MPVDIIESFQLGTNLPLDNRYVADTYFDVSLYWYAGMQVFQESDNQLYWYDGSVWYPVVDTSGGNFVLKSGDIMSGRLRVDASISTDDIYIGPDSSEGSFRFYTQTTGTQDSLRISEYINGSFEDIVEIIDDFGSSERAQAIRLTAVPNGAIDKFIQIKLDNLNDVGQLYTTAYQMEFWSDALQRAKFNASGNFELLNNNHIVTPRIAPSSDSSIALQLTKADGSTPILTIDTLNNKVYVDNSYIPSENTHLVNKGYTDQTFLRESSLGNKFFFDSSGFLDVSISSGGVSQEYVDGSLAVRDTSITNLRNRLDITDSSLTDLSSLVNIHDISLGLIETELIRIDVSLNFILPELDRLDSSISANIDLLEIHDSSIGAIEASLGDYVRKDGDTMTGDLLIETDLSVNGKGTFGEFNVSGNTFPGTPSGGDLFFRTDILQQFVYDSSRGKWLTTNRATYNAGRNRANRNTTAYMNIGDAAMSSTVGLRMPRNGTILAVSIDNDNITTANRTLDIRVNNSTTNRVQLVVTTGNKGANLTNGNQDFSAGDLLQAVLLANGSDRFDDVLVTFEVAWRE